jgi:NO-binding membrane sensor protein with MHYT domain
MMSKPHPQAIGALLLLGLVWQVGATSPCEPGTESSISFLEWAILISALLAAVVVPVVGLKRFRRTPGKARECLGLSAAVVLGIGIAVLGFSIWINYMVLPCDSSTEPASSQSARRSAT